MTKKTKKIIFLHCLVFALFMLPIFVLAQSTGNNTVTIENPFNGGNDLGSLITTILTKVIMPIAAIVSVMYIIWAGFKYVTAQGKPAEIEKANQNLLYALIGVGILLGAAGIPAVIQATVSQFITK